MRHSTAAWSDALARAGRWLLPAECMVCQRALPGQSDDLVCEVCRSRWRAIDAPLCARCGEPRPLGLECRLCADWPAGFGPVRSAVQLDPAVRHLVHRFKYQGWWRLADTFAMRMTPLLRNWPDADLVPIALSRRRLRRRGYNQAEALARALGELTGRAVRVDRLRRARDTATQTRLAPEQRRANLADAFVAVECHRGVILVDDVFTTGATLCSAATELLERGAEQVGAVTFARAPLPLASTFVSPASAPSFHSFTADHP